MSQAQIHLDLSRHFCDKLSTLVTDAFEIADIADLDRNDTVAMIFGNLVGCAATLVTKTCGDKMDFLRACSIVYEKQNSK